VYCSFGDDLTSALHNLQTLSPVPDHILIESSGVALSGAIGGSLSLQRNLYIFDFDLSAEDVATLGNLAVS